MPTKSIAWTDFSMRPVHPTQGRNPVVRTVNMSRSGDGSWRRRSGFGSASGPGSTVLNHISCELDGRQMLVAKLANGTVRYWTGSGSWQTLSNFVDSNDRPIGNALWSTTERGSFALHAGELYICDTANIAAYDGNTGNQIRRPGVKSLAGILYYKEGSDPSFNLAKAEGVGNATAIDLQPNGPSISPLTDSGTNPGITPLAGEKILNCGFAFSVYDPKRGIYGRRSEVCALPYIFGPPNPNSLDIVLTDERAQYSKEITTPGSPTWIPAGHKVAVWFSMGNEIITNRTGTIFSGWFFYFNQWAPAMSPSMTGVLFLEGIHEPGSNISCRKGNDQLARSGMYLDAYSRPVPSRFMVILPNGVALYLWPRTSESDPLSVIGNFSEFSIEHPEQVARLSESNRDSRSPLAAIKGYPVYAVNDGDRSLMFTRQTVHQVGFDGRGAVLQDATNGRGICAEDSLSVSNAGVLWMSDEGVVLMRGGALSILDRKLGFSDWFEALDGTQRRSVVTGVCERTSEIVVGAANVAESPSTKRFMVFDYEDGSVSEWKLNLGSEVYRFAYFRTPGDSVLCSFAGASMHVYPSGSSDPAGFYESWIEMWLNEDPTLEKGLGELVLDLGVRNGVLTVTVDAYEHPLANAPFSGARSTTATLASGGAERVVMPQFMGMRGRLFRITVKSAVGGATSWSISKASIAYSADEANDAIAL